MDKPYPEQWHPSRDAEELADARSEIKRLHDLHLERTKLTTKVIDERDGVKSLYNALLEKYESQSSEGAKLKAQIEDAEAALLCRDPAYQDEYWQIHGAAAPVSTRQKEKS